MLEQEKPYSELQPQELNDEFHKLFGLASAIQISMLGTIIGDESTDLADNELPFYHGILQSLKDQEGGGLVFGNPYAGMTVEEIDAGLKDDDR